MNVVPTNCHLAIKTKGQAPKIAYCNECGSPFWPKRQSQKFCIDKCRHKKNRRDQVQGAEIYRLSLKWRRYRKAGALPALTSKVDEYLREEKQREKVRDGVIAEHKRQIGAEP